MNAPKKKRIQEKVTLKARGTHGILRTAKPEELREMILLAIRGSKRAIKVIGNAFMNSMKHCELPSKPGKWHLNLRDVCDRNKSKDKSNDLSNGSSDDSDRESSNDSERKSSDASIYIPVDISSFMNFLGYTSFCKK